MGYKSDITTRVFETWQEREAFELGARAARVLEWTTACDMEFGGALEELCESGNPDFVLTAYHAGARQLRVVADPWGDGAEGFDLPDAR